MSTPGRGGVQSPESFYDDLAASYHLLFADWDESIQRQGTALSRLIQTHTGKASASVLDCACGIGTQALGLAMQGHRVVASDLSNGAVQRARLEAAQRGLEIHFHTADLRTIHLPGGPFDVVLAGDNALPHLLTDDELVTAVKNIAAHLTEEGILLASMRDYDGLLKDRPSIQPPTFFGTGLQRRFTHQVWDWEGDRYDLHLYLTTRHETDAGTWSVRHFQTRYRALRRAELNAALEHAGLTGIRWMEPAETSFYQPIVIARRA